MTIGRWTHCTVWPIEPGFNTGEGLSPPISPSPAFSSKPRVYLIRPKTMIVYLALAGAAGGSKGWQRFRHMPDSIALQKEYGQRGYIGRRHF